MRRYTVSGSFEGVDGWGCQVSEDYSPFICTRWGDWRSVLLCSMVKRSVMWYFEYVRSPLKAQNLICAVILRQAIFDWVLRSGRCENVQVVIYSFYMSDPCLYRTGSDFLLLSLRIFDLDIDLHIKWWKKLVSWKFVLKYYLSLLYLFTVFRKVRNEGMGADRWFQITQCWVCSGWRTCLPGKRDESLLLWEDGKM